MDLQVHKKTMATPSIIFQGRILKDITGGGCLDISELKTGTSLIAKGALMYFDKSTGLAHIVKTAKLQAAMSATATSIRVLKAHQFKVGDFISNGKVSTEITAITTTETDYDTIALTATLDALDDIAAGTVLYQGASETTDGAVASTVTLTDDTNETLLVSNPLGQNQLKVVIAQAADDNLAVAYASNVLTISLADTTASKNTGALIQAAVRALSDSDGYEFSRFSFTASATWDSAATGDALSVASGFLSGGQAGTDCAQEYTANCVAIDDVDIPTASDSDYYAQANPLTGLAVDCTVIEANLPYYAHSKNKASLTQVTFN